MEPITSIGETKLRDELRKYMKERPVIIDAIAEARGHGDLSENAEYHSARERQSFVEGRIQELSARLSNVRVVNLKEVVTDRVVFGSRVMLEDLDTEERIEYNIVSDLESDPKIGWISYQCPLGKAMMGKVKGDVIDFDHPQGTEKEFEVISIKRMKKIK